MSIFSDIINGGVKGIGDAAKEVIQTLKADPTKLAELEQAEKELEEKLEEAKINISSQVEQAYLKDTQDARNMQTEALKQDDKFSKRFVYYFAAGIILLVMTFDFCLFKIDYPDKNRDMINFISGILNGTAFATIIYFFFGSSAGSKKANDTLGRIAEGPQI